MDKTEFEFGVNELGKSRSQKKRESTALQNLGEVLASFPQNTLNELNLSDELSLAIKDLRSLKKHEARRRQMQLIGRYMRNLDKEDQARLTSFVENMDKQRQTDAEDFHKLEKWRDALIDVEQREDMLAEIAALHPVAKLNKMRHLAEAAAAERNKGKGNKFYRELFRYLRGL